MTAYERRLSCQPVQWWDGEGLLGDPSYLIGFSLRQSGLVSSNFVFNFENFVIRDAPVQAHT